MLLPKLQGSEEAARAAVAAYRFEHVFDEVAGRRQLEADGYEDAWDSFDEDELEMTRLAPQVPYRQALRRLAQAFPELELRVLELVDGVRAAEHNSRPCVPLWPCGHGRLAHEWPSVGATDAVTGLL